jgi:hypothetical protein
MITIEPSLTSSRSFKPDFMQRLADAMNEQLPHIEAKVYIHMTDDFARGDFAAWAVYASPFDTKGIKKLRVGDTVRLFTNALDAVADVLTQLGEQIACHQHGHHAWQRPLDKFNNSFNDGRAVCLKCHIEHATALPKIPSNPIVSMTFGGDYVAQYAWDGMVQAGEKGVVLSPIHAASYTTAFFEAFPAIDGIDTFLRGEGADILSAETDCYEKWQRRLSCPKHEWSRTIRNKHFDDGRACCITCGLEGDALEPLTCCVVCHAPTKNEFNKTPLCYTHYFEKSDSDLLVETLSATAQMASASPLSDEHKADLYDYDDERAEFIIEIQLQKAVFAQLTEAEFVNHRQQFLFYVNRCATNIKKAVFGLTTFEHYTTSQDVSCDKVKECVDYFTAQVPQLVRHVNKEDIGAFNWSLIPSHYLDATS